WRTASSRARPLCSSTNIRAACRFFTLTSTASAMRTNSWHWVPRNTSRSRAGRLLNGASASQSACRANELRSRSSPSVQTSVGLRFVRWGRNTSRQSNRSKRPGRKRDLQNEFAQILVLRQRGQFLLDICGVDRNLAMSHIGSLEAQFLEQPFHDRVQPTGPDILGRLIHAEGKVGQSVGGVRRELQIHALGSQERRVLLCQRAFRFGQNPNEIVFCQISQLDANRKSPLQLGH